MLKKYIQVSRYYGEDFLGSYIKPLLKQSIMNAMDGEFDDIEDSIVGDRLEIRTVLLDEEYVKNLPEFDGY